MRRLLHLPKWLFWSALGVLVLIGVIYIGITRTEYGRQALKEQLVAAFNERFMGELAVGKLTGNVAQTLYATDVRITAPSGTEVAQIDSLVLRPSWRYLLQGSFSVSEIRFFQPHLRIDHADSLSTWASVFARRTNRPMNPNLFRLDAAHIRIVDGRVVVDAPPPRRAAPFAALRALTYTGLTLDGDIEQEVDGYLLDLSSLAFGIPALGEQITMAGQVGYSPEELTVNAFRLTTNRSDLAVQGRFPLRTTTLPWLPEELQVELDALDNGLLTTLWADWPLRGIARGRATLSASNRSIQIDRLEAQFGRTRLRAQGTAVPQGDSLAVRLTFPAQRADLVTLPDFIPSLAGVGLPAVDSLQWSGSLDGSVAEDWMQNFAFSTDGTFQLDWAESRLTVAATLSDQRGEGLSTQSTLQLDNVDLASLRATLPSTRLNGVAELQAEGLARDNLIATASVQLRPSRIGTYEVSTVHGDVFVDGAAVQSYAYVSTAQSGTAEAEVALDFSRVRPRAQGYLRTDALDLGYLLPDTPLSTSYNARVSFDTFGNTPDNVIGQIDVDVRPSTVRAADSTFALPAHNYAFRLATPEDDVPRLTLTGDALEATVYGDMRLAHLTALSRFAASHATVYFQEATAHSFTEPFALTSRRAIVPLAPQPPAYLDLSLSILDATYLTPFLASQNLYIEDGTLDMGIRSSESTFEAEASVETHYLARPGFDAEQVKMRASLQAPKSAESWEAFVVEARATADTLGLGGARLPAPVVQVSSLENAFIFDLQTDSSQALGPLRLTGQVQALLDRTRLTLDDVAITSGAYTWLNASPLEADLYADAIVATQARLLGTQPGTNDLQAIYLNGILSERPQDTLFVNVDDVLLRSFSEVLPIRLTLGGQVNADVALTGGLNQPRVAGQLTGYKLSLNDRIIGNLDVVSRLEPGSSDLSVDLAITPFDADTSRTLTLFGTEERAINERSTLQIGGTYRFGTNEAAGALDLDVNLDALDLFFFELIYPNVLRSATGVASGRGSITGPPAAPIINARVDVPQAQFTIPRFGLDYTVNGTVDVVEEGFDLTGVTATDPTGGQVTLDGMLLFNDYEYFSFDLDATISELQFMNRFDRGDLPFYGQIWASGTASLDGPVYSATLRSTNAIATPNSEIFIPVDQVEEDRDLSFIIFTDSLGAAPDLTRLTRRRNVLARRPVGERSFADGVDMDFNIFAPPGSSINLVFDPLLGDVLRGEGSGRLQLQRTGGLFSIFGQLDIESGDYLFTAGDVFARRFLIEPGGSITWDGSPINALVNIPASFRTRASTAGLPESFGPTQIPLTVDLLISGRVQTPEVDLGLSLDRSNSEYLGSYQALASFLNQPERATEYATSVLLTNTFLLTTNEVSTESALTSSGSLTFNSVSQLVTSQLNRVLSEALPNVDVNFGVSQGDRLQSLDVTGGVALFLLDERLVIRGQGVVFQNDPSAVEQPLEGEVEVEVRLTPNLSFEAYVRREGDVFADELTNTRGAGLTYQTRFSTWEALLNRIKGWFGGSDAATTDTTRTAPVVDATSAQYD